MINIKLDVERIDYDKSVEGLLPPVLEWVSKDERLKEAKRFIAKLGGDTVPVVKKLLGYLDDDAKDEIIVWLLSRHSEQLRKSADEVLGKLFPGAFQIGNVAAENKPGSRLLFRAEQVEVTYSALLDSPLVENKIPEQGSGLLKGAARLLSLIPPAQLEKQGITLLQTDKVKAKMIPALTEGFAKAGLYMTIRGMEIEEAADGAQPKTPVPEKEEGLIPDAFEDALFEGVAKWLRGTL